MRNGNGMGSFMLGLGLGAVVGVAINRWLDNDSGNESKNDHSPDLNLDRQEIAHLAEQFIQAEELH